MKPRTLILQSAAPDHPQWVAECLNSVKQWAEMHGYDYKFVSDDLFLYVPPSFAKFSKVTQSDIARLRLMSRHLWYEAVYWFDADFLIWNRYEFELPIPEPGAIVCAREAFRHHDGAVSLMFNNSVIGLCRESDAELLIEDSGEILWDWVHREAQARMTVIGTDFFSSRYFPLRKIVAKSAGCFSAESIRIILGPYRTGQRHLFWLGVANGGQLSGANLCSSRNTPNDTMAELVNVLIRGEDIDVGPWKYFAPVYRTWLRIRNFPDRIRCWCISRVGDLLSNVSVKP